MNKDAKIYIAGHRGLVGSAITILLREKGYNNLLTRTHAELDLTDQAAVAKFFQDEKPEYVFLAAAKVGGISANFTYPAEYIYQNLQIQNNVIHQAYRNDVKKLLFLGSVCIYPKLALVPVKEEYLLTGELEKTNEPYAIAKIAGLKMCQSYNHQHGTNFIAVMPANLYGPGDNFDLNNSHVLPALIRKFHEAKIKGEETVTLWGTGTACREFLFVDDMAEGCLFLMDHFNPTKEQKENGEIYLNLGVGHDLTIAELAEVVKQEIGYTSKIYWDTTRPDGTPKRLLDSSKITTLGWQPKIKLTEGIKTTYSWYLENNNENGDNN